MVEENNIKNIFPIQNYTTFSIFSGTKEPAFWVEAIKEKGYSTAAICDKQTMGGVIEFQKACAKKGVKPIIGTEFLVADSVAKVKDKGGATRGVILLYATSQKGIKNLIAANNFSHRRSGGFHWFPRTTLSYFTDNPSKAEDLICVVPVYEGFGLTVGDLDLTAFKKSLNPTDLSFKPDKISKLSDIFGKNLYIGINPLRDDLDMKNSPLSGGTEALFCDTLRFRHFNCMAMSFHPKKILTFDSHYLDKEDYRLFQSISKVNKTASSNSRSCKYRDVYNGYVPSLEELSEVLEDFVAFDPYDNPPCMTVEDIQDCSDNMLYLNNSVKNDGVIELDVVKFPIPISVDPEADIIRFIFEGFKKNIYPEADITNCKTIDDMDQFAFEDKYPHEHIAKGEDPSTLSPIKDYVEQLKHEFRIITKLKFINYFWFVRDITAYVDSVGATRGPARGSAAGSILSYLLEITLIDPIRHKLSFERFLNEDRNDLPDIDLDFSKESVAMVREFIKSKYGLEKFCRIGNTGRFKIVSAIKDIAKGFDYGIKDNDGYTNNYNFTYLNSLTANMFVKQNVRGEEELEERKKTSPEFAAFCNKHSNWIDTVIIPLLETVSSNGIHASGNLILPEDLDNCLPIIEKSEVGYVSQWCDTDCEAAGFPKFDLLVIDGADIITYMSRLVEERYPGTRIPTIKEIPLDDQATLLEFQKSKTDGIFQYKTHSYKSLLRKFIIDRFDVLTILGTVNRPAAISAGVPQDMADTQHGRTPVTYDHVNFTDILEESYGYMIYQEQMMKIVQIMASLTGKQTDHVRKACSKKKLEEMQKWEQVFIDGSIKNNYTEEFAAYMWEKIVAFSDYSFNKSHSASYALIAYYQMYLKVRYPVEYWSAVLQFASTSEDKDTSVFSVRVAAEQEGMSFIFPTIDYFDKKFYPVENMENTIVWPLTVIKGIGEKAVLAICHQVPLEVKEEKSDTKDTKVKKPRKKKGQVEEEVEQIIEDLGSVDKVEINEDYSVYPKRTSFKNMEEMVSCIDTRRVHKGMFEALIMAGFFEPQFPNGFDAAMKYYELRHTILKQKLESPPMELHHSNQFEWRMKMNEAFSMIVYSWKSFAPFSEECVVIPENKLERIVNKKWKDGDTFIIGGFVKGIAARRDKNNNHYAIMEIEDYGEKYTVFLWNGFWTDVNLDLEERRPQEGQIIEIQVTKKTFNDRVQLSVGKAGSYCKVICSAVEYD